MDDSANDDKLGITPERLKESLATAGFAFRGFDQTNIGKTPELLAHQIYGPIVEKHLLEASAISSDVLGRPVDLVARVRERREPKLVEYGEAISLIIAVEMAQLELLREYFGDDQRDRLAVFNQLWFAPLPHSRDQVHRATEHIRGYRRGFQ